MPRGYRVRTVTAGGHKVRIAFPPGPRKKGAGQLVSILHPRRENLKCNARKTIAEQIRALESKKARPKELSVREEKKLAKLYMQKRGWNPALSVVRGRNFQQETYETGSRESRERAAQLRKAGFRVTTSSMGSQVTPVGRIKLTLLTIHDPGDREIPPVEQVRWNKKNPYPRPDQFRLAEKKIDAVLAKRKELTPEQASRVRSAALGVYQTTMEHGIYHAGAVHEALKSARYYRPNPNGNGAAQMFEDFHGRAPSEILTLQEALLTSGDYTALGDMGSLWLEPVKGREPNEWPEPDIEFEKSDKVKLATDSKGKQLYLVGGNQKLPLDYLEKHGVPTDKRFISLGEVYGISYLTRKSFDGFRESEYAHEFGEKTGERPFAFYDAELHRIVLVGGAYSIAGVDDALGASPGIVN